VIDPARSRQLVEGQQPKVSLTVTNTSRKEATLAGWIDYSRDGQLDNKTERASVSVPDGLKGDTVTLVFPAVPAVAGGQSYARFRLSTDAGFVAAPQPTGAASDGEVEDFRVCAGWKGFS